MGVRETGAAGKQLEQQVATEAARFSGMRILGPNCLGFANIHSNVYAAFGTQVTLDEAFKAANDVLHGAPCDVLAVHLVKRT